VAWELANLQYLAAYSLAYLGEIRRLQERLPEMLHRAEERDDRFALTNYRIGLLMLAWLAKDRPAEGRSELEDAMRGRTPSKAPWQFHISVYGAAHIDLYEKKPQLARERCEAAWRMLRSQQMLRLEVVRVEQRVMHARSLIACALDDNGSAASQKWLAQAAKEAGRILREPSRWAPAYAAGILGGVAAVRGEVETATSQLGRAAVGFDTLGMALHAASARYQRNRLGGGSDAEDSGQWMLQQGIVRPDLIAAMLLPGVR
jgi:hypothetical protein